MAISSIPASSCLRDSEISGLPGIEGVRNGRMGTLNALKARVCPCKEYVHRAKYVLHTALKRRPDRCISDYYTRIAASVPSLVRLHQR